MNLRVKDICKEKGLSITELAAKMNIAQESLSRAINGNPTISTLEKIAAALGVEVTDLFDKPSSGNFTCPSCGAELKLTAEKAE